MMMNMGPTGITARAMGKAVRFRAAVQVNDFLPISRRDITQFEGAAQAWARALDASGRLPRVPRRTAALHDGRYRQYAPVPRSRVVRTPARHAA